MEEEKAKKPEEAGKDELCCPMCGKEDVTIHFLLSTRKVTIKCEDCGFSVEKPSYNGDIVDTSRTLRAMWKRLCEVVLPKVEDVAIYDKEETYTDCTVQILENTVTGHTSFGWWKNYGNEEKKSEEGSDD